jgi:cytochrome P450
MDASSITLEHLETDPHPILAQLRPVAWVPVLNGWLVTGRELALRVMRDAETFTVDDPRFSTGRVVGPSMLTRDGGDHVRHRDPFAEPLRLAAVRERFAPLVEAETNALIDAFEGDGHAGSQPGRTACGARRRAAARPPVRGDGAMLGWYDAIVDSVTGVAAGRAPTEAGRVAFETLRDTVEPVLESSGDLSRPEVVSNAAVMMFGGIETTEGMIANLVFHLLSNGENAVEPNAVEESLRLEPAAAVIDRYATRDVVLEGAEIRKGDFVEISLAGANRDPDFFPEPDRFDIHRENARHHVTFAHGPHVCIGMHLARLEALTAAQRLFERLPRLRLDPDRPTAPRGLVFRKPPTLDVLWDAA